MQKTLPPPRLSSFAVFRRRDFTLLWVAQFISAVGSGLASVAATLLVYRATGSALGVGLVLVATTLPGLAVGMVAGVFVDRYDRRRIMVVADLTRALLVLLIPPLLPFSVASLYLLIAAASIATQFFEPAQASLVPDLASGEELAAANSMMTISVSGAEALGMVLAGLIAAFDITWAFYLNALTYLLSMGCLLLLKAPPLPAEETSSIANIANNLRAGLHYVRSTPILRSLFLLFALVFLFLGLDNALTLPFTARALGASEFEYGLIESVGLIGFVVGSLLMARLAGRLHIGQWIAASILGVAISGALFALSPTVPAAIALVAINMFLHSFSHIGRSLVLQRNTPRSMLGRVVSAFLVTCSLTYVLGMAAAGLADVLPVRWLLLVNATLLLGCGLLALRLPGLGQPTAEWRRVLHMLRSDPQAPSLGLGRAASADDIAVLVRYLPALAALSLREQTWLAAQSRICSAGAGVSVLRQGEASDATYFLLSGRTVAIRGEGATARVLEVHGAGGFFGEIAALTARPRTADVVAEHDSELLQVPAATLRLLVADPRFRSVFASKVSERAERMKLIDVPRLAGLSQTELLALRSVASEAPA